MFPLVSVSNLIGGLFSFFISIKGWLVYERTNHRLHRDFFLFSLFISLGWLSLAVPGIFSNNVSVVSFSQFCGIYLLHISAAFFIKISSALFGKESLKKFYFPVLILSIMIFTLSNIFDYEPSTFISKGNFYHWMLVKGKPWLRIIMGIVFGIIPSLTGILLSFSEGLRHRKKIIRRRSIFLGFGYLCILLGSLINFIIGSKLLLFPMFIGSILAIIGMYSIYLGITYSLRSNKGENEKNNGAGLR